MKTTILFSALITLYLLITSGNIVLAQSDDRQSKIREAMSAAPPSISEYATILDNPSNPGGNNVVLRKGTNGWTCFPDNPNMPGENPRCLDGQAIEFLSSIADKREPNITRIGYAYFLQGGGARSNTNPWDTSSTPDNEWIEVQVPHIVLILPDKEFFEGLTTKSDNGGP